MQVHRDLSSDWSTFMGRREGVFLLFPPRVFLVLSNVHPVRHMLTLTHTERYDGTPTPIGLFETDSWIFGAPAAFSPMNRERTQGALKRVRKVCLLISSSQPHPPRARPLLDLITDNLDPFPPRDHSRKDRDPLAVGRELENSSWIKGGGWRSGGWEHE